MVITFDDLLDALLIAAVLVAVLAGCILAAVWLFNRGLAYRHRLGHGSQPVYPYGHPNAEAVRVNAAPAVAMPTPTEAAWIAFAMLVAGTIVILIGLALTERPPNDPDLLSFHNPNDRTLAWSIAAGIAHLVLFLALKLREGISWGVALLLTINFAFVSALLVGVPLLVFTQIFRVVNWGV